METAQRLRSPQKHQALDPSRELRSASVRENMDILLPSLTASHHPIETFFDLLQAGKIPQEGTPTSLLFWCLGPLFASFASFLFLSCPTFPSAR